MKMDSLLMLNINNKVIYFFSDVINKALPFISIIYIANYFKPSDFGELEIFVSLYVLYGFLVGFGFDSWMLAKFYKEENEHFYKTMSAFFCCISVLSFFIFLICYPVFGKYSYVIMIGLSNALLNIYTTMLRLNDRYSLAGCILIMNSMLNFLLLIFLFEFYQATLDVRIGSLIIVSFLTINIVSYLFYVQFYKRPQKDDFLKLDLVFYFCFPLCLSLIASWTKGNIDKIYIKTLVSTDELGFYAVSLQIASVLNVVCITINRVLQVSLFKDMSEGRSIVNKITVVSIFLFFASLFYYVIINLSFSIFFNDSYNKALDYIPYLLLSFWLGSCLMLMNNVVVFFEKTKYILYQVCFCAVFQLLLSYFLVTKYLVYGAIISNLITSAIAFSIVFFVVKHLLMKFKVSCNV